MSSKTRPYYGWVIVCCAASAMVATLPGRSIGLGLINAPLMASFGFGEVEYAQLNLIAIFLGALFCVPFGGFGDRFGIRPVLTAVLVLLGATVFWMSRIESRPALAVAMTLLRGLGESALSVISMALVGKWFSRRISMAMGIYSVLIAFGFVAAIVATGESVKAFGWRETWQWVGIVILTGGATIGWMVVCDPTPNTPGYDREFSAREELLRVGAEDFTLTQTIRTPAFWCYALGAPIYVLAFSAMSFYSERILEKQGFPPHGAQNFLALVAGLGVVCNLVGGWLGTKIAAGKLLGGTLTILALALSLFPHVDTQAELLIFAGLIGGAGGIITVVFFSIWAESFGRLHLGRIQGAAQVCSVVGSAAGPLLLAMCGEHFGSYEVFFYGTSIAAAVFGLACFMVPAPALRPETVAAV